MGVAVGMLLAVAYSIWDNKRYSRISDEYKGFAPPESRFPIVMIGSVAVPIGLFWFAWTNYPSIHYLVSIAAGVPFGFGMVLVFLGIMNYLIDAYTIFAASVLAANAVLRSLFGFAFPLFTTQMYASLGIHWASTIPAFLALVCVPFPFLFYKYGAAIRARCRYAREADEFMRKMQKQMEDDSTSDSSSNNQESEAEKEKEHEHAHEEAETRREEEEQEAIDYSYGVESSQPRFEKIKTTQSRPQGVRRGTSYDGNPFDLDRVNTRESFKRKNGGSLSRASSRASRK